MDQMKKYRIILALLAGIFLMPGCEEYLDLKPLDSQTEVTYFRSLKDFQDAANHLHTNVYAWGGNTTYPISFDWGSDLVSAGGDWGSGINPTSTADEYYTTPYKWLRTVNQVIQKGETYNNPGEIAGPIGQAYFFRAWHHFFLLKRYGGVIIANKVTSLNDDIVLGTRASRYEVVKQILDDLDIAIAKLASTTVTSTNNDGHVTLEAAKAFKARVCLFEATWEKYVGSKTNGDGITVGGGNNKPSDYPSVDEMFVIAKNLSKEIIDGGKFQLWDRIRNATDIPASVKNPEMYAHRSYYYLFNLEGANSNPVGLDKSTNKEAIFRSVYDAVNRKSGTNLTHTWPAGFTRKLSDMYLCTDGLPVHLSPLFKGYTEMNAEIENRDYRAEAVNIKVMDYWWGWGMYKTGAVYTTDIKTLAAGTYQNIPDARNGSVPGIGGMKFRSNRADMGAAGDEAADYLHIRLAEVYLIYAEAVCELGSGAISDADLDYSINKVRARGGVAPLNSALIAQANVLALQKGYGQLNLLGEIRRERAVELYAEGHRISDLCRWGLAEAELGGKNRCGGYLDYNGNPSFVKNFINPIDKKPAYIESSFAGKINQEKITFAYEGLTPTEPGCVIIEQAANRQFSLKNYLQPIPSDEIKLNPKLKQNPGW
jgi:starch-binding outer membrane protein, SusD/RagB family